MASSWFVESFQAQTHHITGLVLHGIRLDKHICNVMKQKKSEQLGYVYLTDLDIIRDTM